MDIRQTISVIATYSTLLKVALSFCRMDEESRHKQAIARRRSNHSFDEIALRFA
jgi:hypothetical protein